MLKRILTVFSFVLVLGCSKNAQDNNMLIGNPWSVTYFYDPKYSALYGPLNAGSSIHFSFFKSKNTQGAATFTEIDTNSLGIHSRTASFHYAVANKGTEIKFSPEDSAKLVFAQGSGTWHIDDISSNSLKLTFEDDTTHLTQIQMVR